ncbi:MAG: alcohol dehydrogenase catalytic domain-containing protein [Candidatus Hodarchaeota archaeon]
MLVKVHAVSVNANDLHVVRGNLFIRLFGSRKPSRLGCDLAGRVKAIGSNVAQ